VASSPQVSPHKLEDAMSDSRKAIAEAAEEYFRALERDGYRPEGCSGDDAANAILAALDAAGWVAFRPSEITRIDIIGERVSETWADECFASVQDEGRTLKLFPYGEGLATQELKAKSLVADLKAAIAARRRPTCDTCAWKDSDQSCPGRWCEKRNHLADEL